MSSTTLSSEVYTSSFVKTPYYILATPQYKRGNQFKYTLPTLYDTEQNHYFTDTLRHLTKPEPYHTIP